MTGEGMLKMQIKRALLAFPPSRLGGNDYKTPLYSTPTPATFRKNSEMHSTQCSRKR